MLEKTKIMKVFNKFYLLVLMQVLLFALITKAQSPTPGLVYQPASGAGASVLDPNTDGFTSVLSTGFVANDVTESEIPFVEVPPLFPEISGDQTRGPNCGFTDLVSSGGSGLYTYLDGAGNLMFRFRIGNSIKGSKGYSVLIDTDGKMGNSGANADPNYIGGKVGNPGFEVEIVLETNHSVSLYDVDGTVTPILKVALPENQYSQQSIALSTNCGDPDYFYDFFMPFSVITSYFPSFTSATPVRFTAVTVMAPKDALSGPTSDTYGAPNTGTLNQQWIDIINAFPPTCFACLGTGFSTCSDAPVVNSPIAIGATNVSGTSTEANGTIIRVYKNGTLIGSTTVTGGTWTYSGIAPALINGDAITAKAQATGESACLFSNQVTLVAGCSSAPTISCLTRKGAQGSGPAGAPVGTVIKGYRLTNTGAVLIFTVATVAGNTWVFDCGGGGGGCAGGTNCITSGASYYTTATEAGRCESDPSAVFDLTCSTFSTTPTVTTSPVYDYTTTINGTSTTATGTVYMFVNSTFYATTTISASTWSFTLLSLNSGDTLTFKKVDGGNCMSAASTVYVQCLTSIASIDTPIANGATTISGTSTEAAGTTITIYKNGVSIGTTSVLANGTWTKTAIAPALLAGNTIYVTQKTSSCNTSAASPTTTVVAQTPAPVIVGTYYEQGSSVSGTSATPNGTVINVYIDNLLIGTTTVSGGNWSLTGLDTTALYTSGVLSSTATETGLAVSPVSNLVTVNCVPPLTTVSATLLTPFLCNGDSASVRIFSTQNQVVYTIVNQLNTAIFSVSKLGTGLNITILTFPVTSSQWVKIRAEKIGGVSCFSLLNDSLYITSNNYPTATNAVSGPASVCTGNSAMITVANSQLGIRYQLRDSVTMANLGSTVAGNGGSINLNSGALTSNVTIYVWAVDTTTSANCSSTLTNRVRITVTPDIPADAGVDQILCNSASVTLTGNSPSPGTGLWTRLSGPNSPTITSPSSSSTTVTGLTSGIYVFRYTITNGPCIDFDDVQITNYGLPTAANAGSDQSLCNVTSATLAGNTPGVGSGNWTLISGPNVPSITSSSSPGTNVTGMISGVYVFRWSITNGTCAASTDDVQFTIDSLPTIANANSDQSLCNVTSTSLNANSPSTGSGTWTLISGPNVPTITSPGLANTSVTGMVSGVYDFRWSISNGSCSSSTDDVLIIIYALPTVANAGPDQSLCNVSSATLGGNAPAVGAGNWTLISGPNVPSITSSSSPGTNVTGMVSGVYVFRWSITNGPCAASTDDVQITIYTLPTVSNANVDQSLCNTTSANLNGNTPVTGSGMWSLISGPNVPTITTPSSETSTVTGMISGVYVFRWTISNGSCANSTDDIQITIYSLPTTANAGPDQSLCNVTSTSFSANTPTVGTGSWSFVSGPNVPSITSASNPSSNITGMVNGIYIFRWTISNGTCSNSFNDVQITIYSLPTTANAGADQSLCNVTTTALNGNNPASGTGNWSVVSGPNVPTIVSPSSANSSISGMTNGVYVFRWTITNGVCASSSDDIQITIFATPTISSAGADQNLCNVTSTNLNGNSPTNGSGNWTLVSGPNSPTITTANNPTSSVTGLISGSYIFRWTISNGVCASSTDDVQITIYATPTVSNAGVDQNLCNVTSATMSGNSPIAGNGTWTLVSGPNSPTITSPSNPLTTITGMISGTYIFNWTISNGTCASSTDDVQVVIFDLPSTANAGADQNLCNATTTSLAANNPTSGSGVWTVLSGPNSPTITSSSSSITTVNGMVAGTYIFRWTISNGICAPSSDDVTVIIYPTPTTASAGADQDLCNVTSTTFAANNPVNGSGNWTLVSGPNVPVISTPANNNSTVTGMIAGVYIYRWTITSGVCANSTDDVQITIYDLPTISNAGIDQSICNASSTSLAANSPSSGMGTWSQISGPNSATFVSPNSNSSIASGLISGTYIFRWTIGNGVCSSSSDDVQIINYDLPTVASAGSDQDLCSVTSITLSGNSPTIGTGLWTLLSGPNAPTFTDATQSNTTVTGIIPGTYIFHWAISNGVCSTSSDDVQFTIYATVSIVDAGPDQNICNLSSTLLSANNPAPGIGTWTIISGPNVPSFSSVNDPNATISGLIAGSYILGWTIVNGSCTSSTDSITLNLYDLPTVANAGIDQGLCSTTSFALAGNNPVVGNGIWTLISGPNSPTIVDSSNASTTISGAITGTYIFRWSISNGSCAVSNDDVQIVIYNIPLTVDAGVDQELCNTTVATLSGNTPTSGTGTWTFINGPYIATFVDSNDPNTVVNGLAVGTYIFGWTINNGACTTPTDTIIIKVDDLPSVANAGVDLDQCNINSISLSGSSAAVGAGLWSTISGPNMPVFADSSSNTSNVDSLLNGTYTFVWSISNGVCPSSIDTVQLINRVQPNVADAGIDQINCNVSTVSLAGNTAVAANGYWSLISGPNSPMIVDTTNENTSVNSLVAGNYIFRWTIDNNVCSPSTDDVMITIHDLPTAAVAGSDQNLCNAISTTLSANSVSVGSGLWIENSGPSSATFTSLNNPNSSIGNLVAGSYELIWTTSNGNCPSSSDTMLVTVDDLPSSASAGLDQNLCNTTSISLSGNNPLFGSGMWNVISGPNSPTVTSSASPSTSVSNLIAGTYVFEWQITNGVCAAASDSATVTISALPVTLDAGVDQIICNQSSTTLNGNVPSSGIGQWSLLSGGGAVITNANDPTTTISSLSAGVYQFGWEINNGTCTTVKDTMQITIYDLPTNSAAGSDQFLCNLNSTNMVANLPSSGVGSWYELSGPSLVSFSGTSDPSTSISNLSAGNYSFTWTITNGSCSTSVDTILISVDDAPSLASAGIDQALCNTNTITLNGNNPSSGSGNWTLISGPNTPLIVSPNSSSTSVNGIIPGTYKFEWRISNGTCSASADTVSVTINGMPAIVDAGVDQLLCNQLSCTLNGNSPAVGLGTWSFVSGPTMPTFVSLNDPNTIVNNLSPGTYIFGWEINNGTCTSTTDQIQVTIYSNPETANAGLDQEWCNVNSTLLSADPLTYGNGNWSFETGPNIPTFQDASSASTNVNGLSPGIYSFIWTVNNGTCVSNVDTVLVKVDGLSSLAVCGIDQTVCSQSTIIIDANVASSGIGVWSMASGPTAASFASDSSAVTTVDNLAPGNYVFVWTIDNGTCSANSDSLQVTISNSVSMPDAGTDQSYCEINSVQLSAATPAVGTGLWSLVSGNATIADPTLPGTSIDGLTTGVYMLRWTINGGSCTASDDVQITINANPIISINNHYFKACGGDVINLIASGGNNYTWSPNVYLSNNTIYNPVATPRANTYYLVTGVDNNGCIGVDSALVELCDTLMIPDGFSPDGDGVNDEFVITGIDNYPGNKLEIFNRWGNILYQKNNYDNSWNGTANTGGITLGNGKVVSGTYFYVLDLGLGEKPRAGYLIIKY